MNVTKMIIVLLGVLSVCSTAMSRAISHKNEETALKRSKRSSSADHNISDKLSRDQATLNRQYMLAEILRSIDTSGESANLPDAMLGSGLPSTETTRTESDGESSGVRSASKRRRGRGRGRKGRRNNKRKGKRARGSKRNNRKNKRRHTRSLADNVIDLLESSEREQILEAIAHVIDPEDTLYDNVEEAEEIIRNSSARKCECSKSGGRRPRRQTPLSNL